jgi:hypothetical protein
MEWDQHFVDSQSGEVEAEEKGLMKSRLMIKLQSLIVKGMWTIDLVPGNSLIREIGGRRKYLMKVLKRGVAKGVGPQTQPRSHQGRILTLRAKAIGARVKRARRGSVGATSWVLRK